MVSHCLRASNDRRGITLLFTVVILGSLTLITFSVVELVLTLSRVVSDIGDSERALYAAESGIEQGLYFVEKRDDTLPLLGAGILSNTGAEWERSASELTIVPMNDSVVSATIPSEPISPTNPLRITLRAGESFQMDLDIPGATYPTTLSLQRTSLSGSVNLVVLGSGQQVTTAVDSATAYAIPSTGTIGTTPGLKLLMRNSGGSTVTYHMTPSDGILPLGIVISSTGTHNGLERNIQVEKKNWLVISS